MADNEAFDKFRECAVEVLHVAPEKVTPEASFADDLDADFHAKVFSRDAAIARCLR